MNKISIKNLAYNIIFIIFVFQTQLQDYITIFQYYDELMTVAALLILFFFIIRNKKVDNWIFVMLSIVILYIFYGLLCNYFNNVAPIKAILTDVTIQFKLFICFMGFYIYFYKIRRQAEKININLSILIFKIIAVITVLFYPIMLITKNSSMIYDYRYGLPSYCFIFGHAGSLGVISLIFLSVFTVKYSMTKNRSDIIFIVLSLFLMMSTLRTRIIMIVVLYLMINCYFNMKSKEIKRALIAIAIPLAIIIVGYDAIDTYFIGTSGARASLFKYGIKIFVEKMPFGYGFGTYGSYAASAYYSQLYYDFGFPNIFGLSPGFSAFATDNYWPMILGQFGLVGFILTCTLIFILYYQLYKKVKFKNRYIKTAVGIIGFFIIINSTASAAFVHYSTIAFLFTIFLLINIENNQGVTDNAIYNSMHTDLQ